MKRDEKRHALACATSDVTRLSRKRGRPSSSVTSSSSCSIETHETPMKYTRSQSSRYDKTKCFFCQGKHPGPVHACRTQNVGSQIFHIMHNSNKSEWTVNYANVISEHDALSRNIVYHNKMPN